MKIDWSVTQHFNQKVNFHGMGISNDKLSSRLNLFTITWPIFMELFLQIIMGSTDTVMLSPISDDAVAAVKIRRSYFVTDC
ncbi:hypothetical protein V7075_05570 [Neobacillus drentensis]|uniref:hypothetical protein n=1 Tax=Neobacillus drentensis TaxID=220684 RepID=UPI00300009FE